MNTDGKKNYTWVQCQTCGRIYEVPYKIEVDELYVDADCPSCGDTKGLNLGDEEETYEFYNVNLDPRHYNY